MPLGMLDKCINHSVWVIMKGKREFAGTLLGFDDFFNMVLGGVTEVWIEGEEKKSRTSESILLNGHDIAFVSRFVARWYQETILSRERRSQLKKREKRSKLKRRKEASHRAKRRNSQIIRIRRYDTNDCLDAYMRQNISDDVAPTYQVQVLLQEFLVEDFNQQYEIDEPLDHLFLQACLVSLFQGLLEDLCFLLDNCIDGGKCLKVSIGGVALMKCQQGVYP